MKIKEGFKLRKLGNERILVSESSKNVDFNKLIAFNETAAFLWENIEGKEFTPDTLADMLLSAYDVDADRALADARTLCAKWKEAGIAE